MAASYWSVLSISDDEDDLEFHPPTTPPQPKQREVLETSYSATSSVHNPSDLDTWITQMKTASIDPKRAKVIPFTREWTNVEPDSPSSRRGEAYPPRTESEEVVSKGWKNTTKPVIMTMTPKRALDLHRSTKIRNLEATLLSNEANKLHQEGWYYSHTVHVPEPVEKGSDDEDTIEINHHVPEDTDTHEYTSLTVKNPWSDLVIYRRDL